MVLRLPHTFGFSETVKRKRDRLKIPFLFFLLVLFNFAVCCAGLTLHKAKKRSFVSFPGISLDGFERVTTRANPYGGNTLLGEGFSPSRGRA